MLAKFADIDIQLKQNLTTNRYIHSIGVAYTATSLAMRYGENIEVAFLAGLVHDCAKCLSDSVQVIECERHHLDVTNYEKNHPQLLHAKLSSVYAKINYGIDNKEILDAIKWHTTGTVEMTLLAKIIYIADFIEPNRKNFDGLDEARKIAFENIDKAMCVILNMVIEYQKDNVDETSVIAYRYYKQLLKEGGQ